MIKAKFDRVMGNRLITVKHDEMESYLTVEGAKRLREELDDAITQALVPPWKIAEVRVNGTLFHAVVRNDTLNHWDAIIYGAAAMFWVPKHAEEFLAKKNAEGTNG